MLDTDSQQAIGLQFKRLTIAIQCADLHFSARGTGALFRNGQAAFFNTGFAIFLQHFRVN